MAAGSILGGEGERRFSEEVHIPLSAPEHVACCPRQSALICVRRQNKGGRVAPRVAG
jgi:hypothetical protein